MAVTWTTQRTGNWSLISSNASSPWYDAGTQTALARTPGSSSNANNDIVVIANGHTLTCDASVTIGDSANPTTVNSIANASSGTGILNVSTGVALTVVSKVVQQGSAVWTFSAGSALVFNSSSALTWTVSQSSNSAKLVFSGTPGSRCTVSSSSTGLGRFAAITGFGTSANFDFSYTDFTSIGDSSNSAITSYTNNSSGRLVLDHCTFTTCGSTNLTNTDAASYLFIDSCTWTSTAASRCIIPTATQSKTTGTRVINNCYFDAIFGNVSTLTDWTITGNCFAADVSSASAVANAWAQFSGNLWWTISGNRYITGPTSSSNTWNYALMHSTAGQLTNIHPFAIPITLTGTVTIAGWIFEPGNTTTDGDIVITASSNSSTTLSLSNWLILPNFNGIKCGKFVSMGRQTNLTTKINHNTVVSDGTGETGVIQWGENYAPLIGAVSELQSNLCWDYITNNGMLAQAAASSPSGTVSTSGTAVTGTGTKWVTGTNDGSASNITIAANNWIRFGTDTVAYQVQSVTDDTHLTLVSGPATKTNVSWNILVKDVITTADYNGKYNMATGTDGVGYNSNSNYPWFQSFSSPPGAHDVVLSGNPFIDNTRGIRSWVVYKGQAASGDTDNTKVTNAMAYIKTDPANLIADLVTYIKAGWSVNASSLNNAGHDGVTIGALPFTVVDPVFPNMSMSCTMP